MLRQKCSCRNEIKTSKKSKSKEKLTKVCNLTKPIKI